MKPDQEVLRTKGVEHRFSASENFQLGDACIKPALNRIEISAEDHQIEPKVMKVLLILCSRPGHVVPREHILEQVWGPITDDYLLNRAVSELRKILSDNAQQPHYIETIRKTGYRLLASIKPLSNATLVAAQAETECSHASYMKPEPKAVSELNAQASISINTSITNTVKPDNDSAPHLAAKAVQPGLGGANTNKLSVAAGLKPRYTIIFFVILAAGLGLAVTKIKPYLGQNHFSMAGYQVLPVTSRIGREYEPAMSADGSRIAYVVDEDNGDSTIFVKMIRGQKTLRLSADGERARFPTWMPDGQQIIYANTQPSTLRLMSVSPLGGHARVLYVDQQFDQLRGITLSPSGEHLVFSKRISANSAHQLWLLSINSGELTQLTFPKAGSLGDIDPLYSADGKSLIFVRANDEVTKDIYQVAINISAPENEPVKRLTFDNRKINGVTWAPSGNELLFTSTRTGLYRLWSLNPSAGEPEPLALGLETVQRPTTVLGINALVFEDWKHQASLLTVDLQNLQTAKPSLLSSSTRWDSNPTVSPASGELAFASNRGGPFGIWLSNQSSNQRSKQGSDHVYEWFNLDGAFIDHPAWSPDGSLLVFDASPDGKTQLYLAEKDAVAPKILELGGTDNRNPSWSVDGEWIYFESNRSGEWQLYAWQVATKEIRRLAIEHGKNPQESVDGQWLLFALTSAPGIWRCPRQDCLMAADAIQDGSKENTAVLIDQNIELLVPGVQPMDATNWVPAKQGIYFIQRQPEQPVKLAFYRYTSQSIETITEFTESFRGWGMTITPDESQLIFTEYKQQGADIRIAIP